MPLTTTIPVSRFSTEPSKTRQVSLFSICNEYFFEIYQKNLSPENSRQQSFCFEINIDVSKRSYRECCLDLSAPEPDGALY